MIARREFACGSAAIVEHHAEPCTLHPAHHLILGPTGEGDRVSTTVVAGMVGETRMLLTVEDALPAQATRRSLRIPLSTPHPTCYTGAMIILTRLEP